MVIVSPLSMATFPFQMAELHGLQMAVIQSPRIRPSRDDLPSTTQEGGGGGDIITHSTRLSHQPAHVDLSGC